MKKHEKLYHKLLVSYKKGRHTQKCVCFWVVELHTKREWGLTTLYQLEKITFLYWINVKELHFFAELGLGEVLLHILPYFRSPIREAAKKILNGRAIKRGGGG